MRKTVEIKVQGECWNSIPHQKWQFLHRLREGRKHTLEGKPEHRPRINVIKMPHEFLSKTADLHKTDRNKF